MDHDLKKSGVKKKKVMNSVLHTDGFKIRNIPAIVTKLTKPFELLCFACMELIFPTIHVRVISGFALKLCYSLVYYYIHAHALQKCWFFKGTRDG